MKLFESYTCDMDVVGLAGIRFDLLLVPKDDSENIFFFPDLDKEEWELANEFVEYLENVYKLKFKLYWNGANWEIKKV